MSSTGLRKSSIFALERTSYHAGTWWFAPIAGVIAAVIFYLMGRPMPFADWLPDNAPLRTAYEILFSIFAAYVFVFSLWLCWSPLHFRFETRGGFRKVAWNKTRNLRVEGWHLIVSGGIGAGFFLIIMIVGIIWHVILPPKAADARSSASTATIKSEPMNPEPEPLPKGAKFRIGNHIFWHVPHEYTSREAAEILDVAEDLDNYLLGKMIPVVTTVQEFVNSIPSAIKEIGGPKQARNRIHEMDLTQLIPTFQQIVQIAQKYPTHRTDINDFLMEAGIFGSMRGDMHAFEAKLDVLPDDASAQLIDATAGNAKTAFANSLAKFHEWVRDFHQRPEFAKPELRFLINGP
jgi:hypothetical protein